MAAAASELRRIVRPGGVALASTNSGDTLAEMNGAFADAVSTVLGQSVSAWPVLPFTLETGAAVLGAEFETVEIHEHQLPLAFPGPDPVVAYFESCDNVTAMRLYERAGFRELARYNCRSLPFKT